MSEDAGIELRIVAALSLTARRSNHSARSHRHSARYHPGMQVVYARESLERGRGRDRVERGDEKKDEEEYSYVEEWRVEKKRLKR